MIRLLVCFTTIAALIPVALAGDGCKFTDSSKGTIDISSLSEKDGKARFSDQSPSGPSNWKYSYNPCRPFSEGQSCIDVAVCQASAAGDLQYTLGKQDSAQWDAGAGPGSNPILSYSYADPSGTKNVKIELICNDKDDPELVTLGETPPGSGYYDFQLLSKCSCWNGCKGGSGGGGDGNGFPFGAIFIIILVSLLFIYVVGFTAFNCIRTDQRGLGALPHRTFWVGLPVYAKDGVMFLVHVVTRRGDGKYSSV